MDLDLPALIYRCARLLLVVVMLSLVGLVVLKIIRPSVAVGAEGPAGGHNPSAHGLMRPAAWSLLRTYWTLLGGIFGLWALTTVPLLDLRR
jgi:hypothetical protein